MTKISRYEIDDKVTGSDKWIGSDSQTQYSTKNFTPTKLAVYFNENQVIDIGIPIRYKYDILEVGDLRLPGTITFNPQVGTPYSFSNITSFLLSKYTLKGNDVTEYLNFLISSKILIYKSDNINLFGLFKIVSLVENILEPNFFDVVLEYITGNGSIVEDKDYLISLVGIPGSSIPTKTSDLINDGEDGVHPFITAEDIPPSTIPSLNEVLTIGNTSILDAKIGSLYPWDITNEAYGKIEIDNDNFIVTSLYSSRILFSADNSGLIKFSSGLNNPKFDFGGVGNTTYTFPNNSGTVALTSDITTVGTWGALNYPTWSSGTPFVKMTADGTFALDNNIYLTGITSGQVTTALGYTPVTNARTLTINGLTYDLTADRSWTTPTKTSELINDGEDGIHPFITTESEIVSSTVITGDNYTIELNKGDGSVIPIEFAQSFRHIQSSNSTSWVIIHNLGFRPSVTIIDLDGDTVNGNIIYNTTNQLTLTFAQPIKGEAYLN